MPNYTPNFGLALPLAEEFYDIAVVNGVTSAIDLQLQDTKNIAETNTSAIGDLEEAHKTRDSGVINLLTTGWSNMVQTITISPEMKNTAQILFGLDESATLSQINEFARCGIWATYNGTNTGQIKITGMNGTPTMNLPVRVVWRVA